MSILICYDGSDSAKRAVALCGRTFAGAKVTVLNVWAPPLRVLADSFGEPHVGTLVQDVELEARAVDRSEQLAVEGQRLALGAGLAAAVALRRSDLTPCQGILDAADAYDAELIVLGTRGHSAAPAGLLGSVAYGVAFHSARPVLIVPEPVPSPAAAPVVTEMT